MRRRSRNSHFEIQSRMRSYPRHKVVQLKRNEVYNRATGHCYLCGLPVSIHRFSVDHVVCKCNRGTDELENLMPVHKLCNTTRGNKPLDERQAQRYTFYTGLPVPEAAFLPTIDPPRIYTGMHSEKPSFKDLQNL